MVKLKFVRTVLSLVILSAVYMWNRSRVKVKGADFQGLSEVTGRNDLSVPSSASKVKDISNGQIGGKQGDKKDHMRHRIEAFACKGGGYAKKYEPKAILIGERKCSTDAILRFLSKANPSVKWSGYEAHFFDQLPQNITLSQRDYDKYRSLMAHSCPSDMVVEKTPNYFRHSHIPHLIYTWNKNIKLLLSLRDPISRAVSEFSFLLRRYIDGRDYAQKFHYYAQYTFEELAVLPNGQANSSFDPLIYSRYDVSLQNWLAVFPLSQIHIVDSDAIIKDNPSVELTKVEYYLGLNPRCSPDKFVFNKKKGFYCVKGLGCLGDEKGHSPKPLSENTRSVLTEFFRPHVKNLYRLIGIELSWMKPYLS